MADHPLPDAGVAHRWLQSMLLIRRFEQRASELYAAGRIAGFLHLATGEEATIVGSVGALRAGDYLLSTYRAQAHALARGTAPGAVMAELMGRVDGLSRGRGGALHMADPAVRFMGGYGIVGGHLPIAAGIAMAADHRGLDDVVLCHFGDGAVNQGTFGETLNLTALWRLPMVLLATNNRAGSGAADPESAATDLLERARGFGAAGLRCDGMDVIDTYNVVAEALRVARRERRPVIVEALVQRTRGHSAADPEDAPGDEAQRALRRGDPIATFAARLIAERVMTEEDRGAFIASAVAAVDGAVAFAEASPEPDAATLHDHVLVP
jgi:pyruvate dehydrogenase E1 component alpha subunit